LGDQLGGTVKPLHEHFAGPPGGGGLVAQLFRQGFLVVEEYPVFPASRHDVQPGANGLQLALGLLQGIDLFLGDETVLFQVLPAMAVTGGSGNPQHQLQIP